MRTVLSCAHRTAVFISVLMTLGIFTSAAHAAGTDAGTQVENTFTLDYQVNSISQTQLSNTATPTTFTVDRIVDVTVTSTGNTNVTPGATGQTLVFSVLNSGNDNQAYELSAADVASDDFDATSLTATVFVDDGNGTFDAGADGPGVAYTLGSGTATADIAPDAVLFVVLTGDIPASVTNGQTDSVVLTANSLNPTASLDASYSATPGTETVAETGANDLLNEAQNVLIDGAGVTDGANAGDFSAQGSFIVASAALSASKAVSVIATDGAAITCATDPVVAGNQYAAPGACVEYVITVANDPTASATATDINISDTLPDEVEFVAATQNNFTVAGSLSTPAGTCTASCVVSLTGASLATNTTATLTIRALVR
ncbi:MAG: hypothetical protein AAFR03_08525 [Pseudomonadota bacterium]